MAAGGYGSFTRKHGLFIDGVLSAKVVLANGSVVTTSPAAAPDLFWAIRGGGGGTYGIVTEATVRLFDYPTVTVGALWTSDLNNLAAFMDR
jgi:FAD/FMN-containing dehydrogenase